jgi:tetratricopeptide (TPR) repeat protein
MINKSIIILFLICLFCNPSYGSKLLSEEALNYYNEGVRAQMRDDLYDAEINYQKAILLDTNCKKFVFNNYGVIYAYRGETEKAESAFKEALKIDPDYHVATSNLSLLYLKLSMFYKNKGDVKRAFDNLEKAFCYIHYREEPFIIEEEKDVNKVK